MLGEELVTQKASHAAALVTSNGTRGHGGREAKRYGAESVMQEGGSTASRSTECLTLTPSVAAAAFRPHLAPFASVSCLRLAEAATNWAGHQGGSHGPC